jgi:hypothetical protein
VLVKVGVGVLVCVGVIEGVDVAVGGAVGVLVGGLVGRRVGGAFVGSSVAVAVSIKVGEIIAVADGNGGDVKDGVDAGGTGVEVGAPGADVSVGPGVVGVGVGDGVTVGTGVWRTTLTVSTRAGMSVGSLSLITSSMIPIPTTGSREDIRSAL